MNPQKAEDLEAPDNSECRSRVGVGLKTRGCMHKYELEGARAPDLLSFMPTVIPTCISSDRTVSPDCLPTKVAGKLLVRHIDILCTDSLLIRKMERCIR